ncbi:hypothetical protein F52700_728 [Fusarium sp. NRRL 52700]|nr:hypothetical protein F52700_728 [Fusarium sp. NRRL 52700]
MASSSFHKFSELPPEIRLQTWESSFRSPNSIPGGLHYIGFDDVGSPVPLDKTAKDEFQRARSGQFKRLAFEFKPSWNTQLSQHDNYYPIKKFLPSLAFMLRLVFEAAHIRHFTTPTIRLIDRNAQWINDETAQLGLDKFYDCDYEYVEINMKPSSSSAQIVCRSPILEFFDHLDRLLEDKLNNLGPFRYGVPRFVIRDYFSIIALRQNEVGAAKE